MINYQKIFILIVFLSIQNIYGYVPKHSLEGKFYINVHDVTNNKTTLQLWDLSLLQGFVGGQERFIDFKCMSLHLSPVGTKENEYKIDEMESLFPSKRGLGKFNGSTFTIRWDDEIIRQWYIKIEFNENGTLKDISGNIKGILNPEEMITYKLNREIKDINIYAFNPMKVDFNMGYQFNKLK